MRWTNEQLRAIEENGTNILLSAAAGSGKTAVLTERIVRYFENGGEAERLLVVTFTRKAASEMKQKILRALSAKLEENPGNINIEKAYRSIDLAQISTIDSFCIRLVRENANLTADISPSFRICSEGERMQCESTAMSATMEKLYDEKSADFELFRSTYCGDRDDSSVEEIIKIIYGFSCSAPFPKEKRHKMLDMFDIAANIPDTKWGKNVLHRLKIIARHTLNAYKKIFEEYPITIDDTDKKAYYIYREYAMIEDFLEKLTKAHTNADFDELFDTVNAISDFKFATINKKHFENADYDFIRAARNEAKDGIKKLAECIPSNTAEYIADIEILRPMAKAIFGAVDYFESCFYECKRQAGVLTFDDCLHTAISLVTNPDGSLTELGQQYSDSFDQILIDEYQDTSEAQDRLFEAISNGHNLFMVGDAKQSIYGFRGASPSVFTEKFGKYSQNNGGLALTLSKNFRSDKDIIGIVNSIFEKIMRPEIGNIDYRQEMLCHNDDRQEMDTSGVDIIQPLMEDDEAVLIANYIEKHLGEEFAFDENGEPKKATYSDFCLLFRKKKPMEHFAKELEKRGIPCTSDMDKSILDCHEIMILSAILDIIDNHLNDVSLAAAMFSPIFGFTVDELAEIHMINAEAPLWVNVRAYAENSVKTRQFIDTLSDLRNLSVCMSLQQFIRTVISRLDFYEIAGCINGCRDRNENILAFLELAKNYSGNSCDLHGFMRFLALAKEGKFALPTVTPIQTDSVQLMTMHKSKGLEFPYVIICGVGDKNAGFPKKVELNEKSGLGLKIYDKSTLSGYKTLSFCGVKFENDIDSTAEEERILYVALTRAVNRLVLCGNFDKKDDFSRDFDGRTDEFSLLSCTTYEKFLQCGLDVRPVLKPTENTAEFCDEKPANDTVEISENHEITDKLCDEISQRADFIYPYLCFEGMLAKRSASRSNKGFSTDYVAVSKPAFMLGDKLTPAARGTAYHKFLQLCDFAALAENPEKERSRVLETGRLSNIEMNALDFYKLYAFVKSDVGKAAINADKVYKELPFNIFMKAEEVYPDCDEKAKNEDILIQGMADLVFVKDGKAVIVDYKTDRVRDASDLVERYGSQLAIYKRAVGEVLGIPVADTMLYSLPLKSTIKI